MRPRSALLPYQEEAAALAVQRRRLALLMAPGDGKTATALTALLDARAFPALVAAPALVVETDVWGEEARAWEHLRHLQVRNLVGTPVQRASALMRPALPDVSVVSYENLLWLTDYLGLDTAFCSVVWDELSKMKAPGTKRFKRMRAHAARVEFRLGLTGTPVGNHLLDLWGELHMVSPGALGPTFTGWRAEHFEPRDLYARVWALKGMRCERCRGRPTRCYYCHRPTVHTAESRRHERAIHAAARPLVYARPDSARPGVPPVREVVRRLLMPPELERVSLELRRQLWAELPSGAELEALSASARATKLRQLAGGAVYAGEVEQHRDASLRAPAVEHWEPVHDSKVRALVDLVDELQGEPLLVYYWFRHERERLLAALRGRQVAEADAAGVARWNRRGLDVLLAHPQSAGMGLNLQAGGHHAAWFTLPWARWQYDQGCARLARLGQAAPEVTSHLLLCGPVDEDVLAVLATKGEVERRFMEATR